MYKITVRMPDLVEIMDWGIDPDSLPTPNELLERNRFVDDAQIINGVGHFHGGEYDGAMTITLDTDDAALVHEIARDLKTTLRLDRVLIQHIPSTSEVI